MVLTSESVVLTKRKIEISQKSDNFEPFEDIAHPDKAKNEFFRPKTQDEKFVPT